MVNESISSVVPPSSRYSKVSEQHSRNAWVQLATAQGAGSTLSRGQAFPEERSQQDEEPAETHFDVIQKYRKIKDAKQEKRVEHEAI